MTADRAVNKHDVEGHTVKAEADYYENREWWDRHIASLSRRRANLVRRALRLPAPDPVWKAVEPKVERFRRGDGPL